MEYRNLKISVENGIAVVTVCRPEAMNALNTRFFEEMDTYIASIKNDASVKAVIITGDGKAFVAGADIAEMMGKPEAEAVIFSKIGQNTFRSLELLEKPVIAAINGFALGGGCELAMACDIRLASSKAKFGQPEVNLGVTPGYAATQRLPRLVGLGDALMLLMTGDMIAADEALRIGLVQKVVEPDQLMPAARELAAKIISKGPKAVQYVKYLARQSYISEFEAGCAMESELFAALFENEALEGMKAFLEKRAPHW
jgi:enoyl-CoA hydratase